MYKMEKYNHIRCDICGEPNSIRFIDLECSEYGGEEVYLMCMCCDCMTMLRDVANNMETGSETIITEV